MGKGWVCSSTGSMKDCGGKQSPWVPVSGKTCQRSEGTNVLERQVKTRLEISGAVWAEGAGSKKARKRKNLG